MPRKKQTPSTYLSGLIEGLKPDPASDQGKMLYAIASALENLTSRIEGLEKEQKNAADKLVDAEEKISNLGQGFAYMLMNMDSDDDDFDDDDDDFDDIDFDEEDEEDDDVVKRRSKFHIIDEDDDGDDDDDDDWDDDIDDDVEDDDDDDTDIYVECCCPKCHRRMYVIESQLGQGTKHVCPYCGEHIEAVPEYETDDEILVAQPATDDK